VLLPGSFTLRIQNNTGNDVVAVELGYEILQFNNKNRSNSLNLSYSLDNSVYTSVPSLDFSSTQTASGTSWSNTNQRIVLDLTSTRLSNGDFLYIRWTTADAGGFDPSGRDQLAFDDIQ